MTPEEKLEIHKKGFEEGVKHSSPSSDTLKMVNNLEEKMTEKIKEVKQTIHHRMDKLEDKFDENMKAINNTLSEMGTKFVCKEDYKEDMGKVDIVLEKLKAFRWQLVAGGSVILYIVEKVWR